MGYSKRLVYSQDDQIKAFVDCAVKYKSDSDLIYNCTKSPGVFIPSVVPWGTLWREAQGRYVFHGQYEIILRPEFFWKVGGDCNNQLTAFLAVIFQNDLDLSGVEIVLARQKDERLFGHIFLSVDGYSLDALPGVPPNNWAYHEFEKYSIKDFYECSL